MRAGTLYAIRRSCSSKKKGHKKKQRKKKKKYISDCHRLGEGEEETTVWLPLSLSLCRFLRCQRQLIWSRSRRGLSLPPSRSHTRTCIQCEGHCELKLNAWTFNMAVDKAIRRITERERERELMGYARQ